MSNPAKPLPPKHCIAPAYPWLVVIQEGHILAQQFTDPASLQIAARKLSAGEHAESLLGPGTKRLKLSQITSLHWVPAARTLLVRRHWLFDPWRLTVTSESDGRRTLEALAANLPGAGQPTQARVGPNDLALDPRLILGVLIALMGLFALLGGATEGAGQPPLFGREMRFQFLFDLGQTLGLTAVIFIALTLLATGLLTLFYWFRTRPEKIVVRINLTNVPNENISVRSKE